MAGNVLRPLAAGPPRVNTLRPPRPAEPAEAAAVAAIAPLAAAPEPGFQHQPQAPSQPKSARPMATSETADQADRPAPADRSNPDQADAPASAAPIRASRRPASSWSLFSLLDRFTNLDGLFREGLPVRYLPKLLFVMGLTLLYIGNTHYGNRMNRGIQRLKQETEDLRADYTTLKSDYMEASKQSEVARKVAAIGLVESSSPPFRIAVPAGRLENAALETLPVLTADTLSARAARDSVAQARADAALGRARRQQLGLPATDEPEAGAPPPGPSEEDSLAQAKIAATASIGRLSGTKKYKKSGGSTHQQKTKNKKPASHERQR